MKRQVLKAIACAIFISAGFVAAQTNKDALLMYRNGQFAEAAATCIEEIKVTPRNLDSYVVLCWSLLELKRYEEVIDYGLKAKDFAPFDLRIMLSLGQANYGLGRNVEAIKCFYEFIDTAKESDARLKQVYYLLGEVYIRIEWYELADLSLSAAVYFESRADWWTRLGYAREMGKHYDGSLVAYQTALQLDPQRRDAQLGAERVRALLSR